MNSEFTSGAIKRKLITLHHQCIIHADRAVIKCEVHIDYCSKDQDLFMFMFINAAFL